MQWQIEFEFCGPADDLLLTFTINGAMAISMQSDGQSHTVQGMLTETAQQNLIIEMSGKTDKHTLIDQAGDIKADSYVLIKKISLDDIDISEIVLQGRQCYHHDNNGLSMPLIDEFWGYMGCNGQIKIDFTCPIGIWWMQQL